MTGLPPSRGPLTHGWPADDVGVEESQSARLDGTGHKERLLNVVVAARVRIHVRCERGASSFMSPFKQILLDEICISETADLEAFR